MNRRNKGSGKKMLFEPNIPDQQPEENTPEPKKDGDVQMLTKSFKGLFVPQSFATPKQFRLADRGFILHIPEQLLNSSLVVFSDGSLGFKVNDKIYECDSSFWDETLLMDIKDKARCIDSVEFLVTGYLSEQDI